ncbi:MAG: flavin-containing monooxygenase [Hyphomicrobiales bacterium]
MSEERPVEETPTAELPFDPDALREKYRAERDKRLRADGNNQYREVTGEFAHYLDDPYTEPIVRDSQRDHVDVTVIGGGFAGLLIGARLRQAGVQGIRMIEKGGDFGGTWYWNRYPGAACDTESYIYLPLLEETGYMPTEKYAKGPEIFEHSRRIARQYDLYRDACLQTQVTDLRWDDAKNVWRVKTDKGDDFTTTFVCMANGPLNRPKLPGIPGIETYRGHSFHTSRWDYEYTGGDSYGNLHRLSDKRVGIIGTGATGVQCIPHLGASAQHLYVFQRTPSSIDVRANRPTDPEWVKTLEPGWQRRRMENFSILTSGGFAEEDLVMDGWTEIIGKLLRGMRDRGAQMDPESIGKTMELADFEKMNQIRARVDAIVKDRKTAEALKPWYRQFCKRPCFHDEYLQTYNRPNVTLVDTDGKGVERITERGVVANGVEYEVDCIIYATGFEVGTAYSRRAGYEIYGRNGLALSEKWANGVSTLFGMQSRDFPNCFIVSISQVGASANIPHLLDEQSRHISYIIEQAFAREVNVIDVTEEAESAWVKTVIDASAASIGFLEACTPGYYNNEGMPNGELIRRNGSYAPGVMAFAQKLEEWRTKGDLDGLILSRN